MKFYSIKKVTKEEKTYIKTMCDKCGEELESTGYENGWFFNGHIYSPYPEDYASTHFDLCQVCAQEFFIDWMGKESWELTGEKSE